jgi:transcriptional regulator with XRE-family HTH domain
LAIDPGPMVRRRQLGSALRRYRNAANLSVKEAAERLMCSPSKISRIETAHRNATPRDVRDLCNIYGITDEIVRKELMDLARESRERGWWQDADLDPALETLIGMEGAATTIREYECLTLPGLLQTRDYAEAIFNAWHPDDSSTRQPAVDIRLKRQQILAGPTRPHFHVVIDEAVVRRVVGGPDAMNQQVNHLIRLLESSVIQLQIIPFSAGAHIGMNNGFTILEFADAAFPVAGSSASAVVYVEGIVGDDYNDRTNDVRQYIAAFSRLSATALPAPRTLDLLRTLVRETS